MTSSARPVLDFGAVERSPTGWKSGWSGFLLLRSLREALRNSQSVDLLITTRPIQMNCDFLVALFVMQISFRQQDKNSSFLFWFFMTVTWLQNLTALLMRTDWQCNHCSCKALPVSHPLRFPFHPFCPRPLPFFCPRPPSIDQEATKGTMSHQTLMATSSYSTVHITLLSMLFSFLGGKMSVPGTHQCWQHNVDNSCSFFGFVFQFQRRTAWMTKLRIQSTFFIAQK